MYLYVTPWKSGLVDILDTLNKEIYSARYADRRGSCSIETSLIGKVSTLLYAYINVFDPF